jgi:plasmid stabilization system protein ParE
MAFKLILSIEAERDIEEIVQYIAIELKNPGAAAGFLDDVEKSCLNIVQSPRMYSFCNDEQLRKKDYHKVLLKNYIMVYRVSDDKESVIVLRVFYGRMNYLRLL